MTFEFSIPTPAQPQRISISPGSSAIFVGANGGGKTRLAVHIEQALGLRAHRISAHRALEMNPDVPKISERVALQGLRTGYANDTAQVAHRIGSRWRSKMAVSLLNDFDFVIQSLFAEQANRSLETHTKVRRGDTGPASPTKFERLNEIWDRLLPHRKLFVSGDNIEVAIPESTARYNSSEMSDGERAIFYTIGQALLADADSLLIFDEPELHIHRSIMSKLWDELEAARRDCAFIFITHDLEFAAVRVAQKFVIRDYTPAPTWAIETVPQETGFSEEATTLILGSRRPVLFVEGSQDSLDTSIYRCCFPEWTVIARGSCEEVIHSVVTMRRNSTLTRVTCSGIVDADDYHSDDIAILTRLGIAILPVSEIENLILLPAVSRAIAEHEGYAGAELENRLNNLKTDIFKTLDSTNAIDTVVTRYCRRRIDRLLKKIDLSESSTVAEITARYTTLTQGIDIAAIAQAATDRIQEGLREGDLAKLLANYDNKGLMALAAKYLKSSRVDDFEGWLTRMLRNNQISGLVAALRHHLPKIQAQ
jgi:energy-coupling factor transporter ATP-binding protein EcfA2